MKNLISAAPLLLGLTGCDKTVDFEKGSFDTGAYCGEEVNPAYLIGEDVQERAEGIAGGPEYDLMVDFKLQKDDLNITEEGEAKLKLALWLSGLSLDEFALFGITFYEGGYTMAYYQDTEENNHFTDVDEGGYGCTDGTIVGSFGKGQIFLTARCDIEVNEKNNDLGLCSGVLYSSCPTSEGSLSLSDLDEKCVQVGDFEDATMEWLVF